MPPRGARVVVCRETSSLRLHHCSSWLGSRVARAPRSVLSSRPAFSRRRFPARRMAHATNGGAAASGSGSSDAQGASHKRRKTDPSSRAKKAYPITEVREENGPAAPLLNQAIVISLGSETSTGDVIRQTIEKHVPGFHYVDGDISSLTTGGGTSLGVEFLDEPIRSIAHVLAAGGWRLVAVVKRRGGDAFSPLSDKLVREVFGYVGEAFSLRACERSCRRFRRILSDDDAWRDCRGADGERGGSYREKAFIGAVCDEIRKEQRLSRNTILSVVSLESIRRILSGETFLNSIVVGFAMGIRAFHVRGDALGYLLEVIENYMVRKLDNASDLSALAASGCDIYPEVTKQLLNHVDNCHPYSGRRYVVNFLSNWRHFLEEVENEIGESKRFKLARRLAYKGGVVKITDEALKEVADEVFLLMAFLLRKPLYHHCHMTCETKLQYESEESIDLWNDTPPIIRDLKNDDEHIIVPRFIEDAASEIGLSCYGSNWVLSEGQTLEEAIAEAKARYMVKGEYDWDTDDDCASLDSDDSELKSLSDQSEDGDISEYDDEDCPDEAAGDE